MTTQEAIRILAPEIRIGGKEIVNIIQQIALQLGEEDPPLGGAFGEGGSGWLKRSSTSGRVC